MAIIFDINQRFYKQIAASTAETSDYIPANGEQVFVINMGISSSSIPDTTGCVVWDPDGTPDILISSYGEIVHYNVGILRVGDGVKKLQICLTNDLTEPAFMGAFYQAEILT